MRNSQKDFYKKLLGREGEDLVYNFLKKNGYKILEKNYRTPFGEADIIAKSKDGTIYFIEVKTRSTLKYGTPAEAVNYKKQQKYRDIANFYLNCNNISDVYVCFSVAEVFDSKINFISEAF
ncbi:MAG: YraN family protein [Clostridia bacterium]|nr:YraN family protein [Clostridia bacterium]